MFLTKETIKFKKGVIMLKKNKLNKVLMLSFLYMAAVSSVSAESIKNNKINIYGNLNIGITGGNNQNTELRSGLNGDSFIGFRVSEKLSNDLYLGVTLESNINLDNGSTKDINTTFDRESSLSLNSKKYGTVKIGLQNTPLYDSINKVDPFYLTSIGSSFDLITDNGVEENTKNSISYESPKFHGFKGKINYSLKEGSLSDKNKLGMNATYERSNYSINLGYQQNQDDSFLNYSYKNKVFFIGANYNLKEFHNININIGGSKIENHINNNKYDMNTYLLGVTYPMNNNNKLYASYVLYDNQNFDVSKFSMGYEHKLSNRTNIYAAYSKLNNDNNLNKPGFYGNKYALGIQHKF